MSRRALCALAAVLVLFAAAGSVHAQPVITTASMLGYTSRFNDTPGLETRSRVISNGTHLFVSRYNRYM